MLTDEKRRRVALTLAIVWTNLNLVSAFALFVAGFSAITVVGALIAVAVSAVNAFVCFAFFVKDDKSLYSAARKWFGYAAAFAYAALAIPLADRREALFIGSPAGDVVYALFALSTLSATALWLFLRLKRSQVYWGVLTEEEAKNPKLAKERHKKVKRGLLGSVLEWVDAAAWAVIVVIVFQRLFFQLYAIPSESMVPTLLIGDRPVIAKFLDGPTFPFAPAAFPRGADLKRGSIGVFENPALEKSPPAFRFLQEVVFYLTFSNVDLDRGPDGQPKVSRLIKRVIGVPGDRLMMVDDVLYYQRAGDAEWKPAPDDAAYSHVDLNALPAKVRAKVRNIPIDPEGIKLLRKWDGVKNSVDARALGAELESARGRLRALFAAADAAGGADAFLAAFKISKADASAAWNRAVSQGDAEPWRHAAEMELDPVILARFIASPADREKWLAFLAAPDAPAQADAYGVSARAVGLLVKKSQADRILSLLAVARASDRQAAIAEYTARYEEAAEFRAWLSLYDFRNFPPFPESGYLSENAYFFMGDNRYNSVDCRFNANQARKALPFDPSDPRSAVRDSMLEPRVIEREYILGRSVLRLFPFTRIGPVK